MENRTQQIPLGEINIPDGQRELGDLDGLIGSIQMLGLLEPILVIHEGAHYRLIAGWRRYNACKRLGWPTIEANILEMDDLHAELATIDENMIRQELIVLERSEQLSRRKEIYEALHPETNHQNGGPGRGHKGKKRKDFVSFADDTASKTGCTPRTIQQEVQIATKLSNEVKESIRSLPIANKKSELLRLARLSHETQEAITSQLVSGSAKSIKEAQRAIHADAVPADSTPDTRQSPQRQTSDPRSTLLELDREPRDTLLHIIVMRLKQSSAIAEEQIAGQAAVDVLVARLATLPQPEVVLFAGLMTGPMPRAAEAWVAAVRADVQDEDHHFEGVMPHDCAGDSANDADVPLPSMDDQAEDSAYSVSSAHALMGDNACSMGERRSPAVTEVRAATEQLPLSWGGEEQRPCEQVRTVQEGDQQSTQESPAAPSMLARDVESNGSPAPIRTHRSKRAVANGQGAAAPEQMAQDHPTPDNSQSPGEVATIANPAPHHNEEAVEPAADATRPIGVSAPSDHGDSALLDLTRCGWCGGTQFLPIATQSGKIFCECHSVYNPSLGRWAPGDRDKQQSLPVSVPATACAMQNEIERRSGEATASSTAGGGAFGDSVAAPQALLAGPHDDGETQLRECREIA